MSVYRRILSYLYRYEKGSKTDCMGFIKAEQRNQTLKILIQIKDPGCPKDSEMKLLFYRKKDDDWEMTKADSLRLVEGEQEKLLCYGREDLPDGFDIQDQYGVAVYYQDSFSYGSIWIGEDFPSAWLSEAMMPKKLASSSDTVEKEPVTEDDTSATEEDDSRAEEKAEQETHADTEPGLQISELSMDESDRTVIEADLLEPVRCQAAKADAITNTAFYEGYQISRNQLMQLGEEADSLSGNQFLLKNYEKYHHLLAGKVLYDGEDRYCIGVPGIYENREKYMAQLYQFPVFLSMKEDTVKTGRFGYWLHLIQSAAIGGANEKTYNR